MNDDMLFVLDFEFFVASVIRERNVLGHPTDAPRAHEWLGRHNYVDLMEHHAVKVEHIT
jgi:hypothetical protein